MRNKFLFVTGMLVLALVLISGNSYAAEFEAEDAILHGVELKSHSGASGGYRVIRFDTTGDYILYNSVPDGNCLEITYSLELTTKQCSIYINGNDAGTAIFTSTGSWNAYNTLIVDMNVHNSVKLQLDADDQTANGGASCASQDKISVLNGLPPPPPPEPNHPLPTQDSNHPFLIVTEANFPELQSRAATSPWSAMKSQACSDCLNLSFSTGTDYVTQAGQMDDIASTCALAYILDPAKRDTYVAKFYNTAMTAWPGYLRPGLSSSAFEYTVTPGISYFSSVLALDVMYNGLTSEQRSSIETEFQLVANWYNSANT